MRDRGVPAPAPETGATSGRSNDHNCFGCGRRNDAGLHLSFTDDPDGNGVRATFIPAAHVEGYTGMVHGGIITTVLDEVMAWSLYRHGIWAVTGSLTTRYRAPIRIGQPTLATGTIVRDRGRAVELRGEIRDQDGGRVLADANATFVRVPEDQARAWLDQYGSSLATSEPARDG